MATEGQQEESWAHQREKAQLLEEARGEEWDRHKIIFPHEGSQVRRVCLEEHQSRPSHHHHLGLQDRQLFQDWRQTPGPAPISQIGCRQIQSLVIPPTGPQDQPILFQEGVDSSPIQKCASGQRTHPATDQEGLRQIQPLVIPPAGPTHHH